MPRKPSCLCGQCPVCKRRVQAREAYQALSIEERRDLVSRRDSKKVRAADRARYQRDKPKRRAAADAYAAANRERVNETSKRWRERNPEKYAAHIAVGNAIRDGKLVKQPCEKCGDQKVDAHHDDYSKPLEVRWLCPLHHVEERKRDIE